MIHFFHGQFDHPTIWNNYQFPDHRTKSYNLYELSPEDIQQIKVEEDDILVGYSLGGRIALKIASSHQFNLKKIILLSSHPGLSENEKKERMIWEEEILQRLTNSSMEDFFLYWNSLPLFSQSQKYAPLSPQLFKKSISLFEANRLSNQENFTEEMVKFKDKIIYVFGYQDSKYSEIAWKLALKGIKTFGIKSDHRVHLHKRFIQEIIKRELQS